MRQAVKRLADLDKVVYLLKTIWRKLTDDHSNLEDDMAKKAEVKMVGVTAFSSSFLGARLGSVKVALSRPLHRRVPQRAASHLTEEEVK